MSIEERLGARLRKASLAMRRLFAVTIEPFRISQEQYLLLVHLGEQEPLTQAELSRRSKIDPNTVMDNVRRLEKQSMVRRFRDPDDARIVRVQITEKGRALREESMVAIERINQHLLKGLSKADQRALLLGLDEIARAADKALESMP